MAELTAARAERDAARNQVQVLLNERATLETRAVTAEREAGQLRQQQSNFDVRVAEEIARHGIRPMAVKQPSMKTEDAPKNPDGTVNYTKLCLQYRAANGAPESVRRAL